MATITQQPAGYFAGVHKVKNYPEAASQSFKAGEFVYLVGGKVTVCASDATVILGMAVADATGTTDSSIPVLLAEAGTEFKANVTGAVTAVTQRGVKYALLVTSNKHYVDVSDTDNDAFTILDFAQEDAIGDTYGRVIFRVISSAYQNDTAAT